MIIKDLELTHFGKFHNKKISFLPGLNVIYGRNEVGKSTIHSFIRGMLFGIEKSRGRATKDDRYTKYEPWENLGGYEGKMRFEVNWHIYRIERSFLKTNKYFRLIDETLGKELDNPKETLECILGGLNESIYINTISIEQLKSATDEALVNELKVFASNLGKSKNSEVNLMAAQASLVTEKKRLATYIVKDAKDRYLTDIEESKQLESEIQELSLKKNNQEILIKNYEDKLITIRQRLEEEYKDGESKKVTLQQQIEQLKSWILERETQIKYNRFNGKFILSVIISILGAVSSGYFYAVHQVLLFIISLVATIIASLFFICMSINRKKKKQYLEELEKRKVDLHELSHQYEAFIKSIEQHSVEDTYQQLQEQLQMSKDVYNRLDWEMDKKQELLLKVQDKLEVAKLQLSENDKVGEEIKAIDLAINQMQRLAGNIHNSYGSKLNQVASEYFAKITKGKYKSLVIGEDLSIFINTPQKLIPIDRVSRGTIEQIYLSIRLAAAKIVWKEKMMPLIFDDVFAYYDDDRLKEVMDLFSSMERQIILFTCHKREDELLN